MPTTVHGLDLFAPGGLAALFALHRSTFGDAIMQDPASTGDPAPVVDPPAPPAPPAAVTPPAPGDPAAGEDLPLGPAGIRALQSERTRADTAETELARVRTEAETNATRAAELETLNARLVAIAEHGVPKQYQHLVSGTDAATYAASALEIANLAAAAAGHTPPAPPVTPPAVVPDAGTGGTGGGKAGGTLAAGADEYRKSKKTK